MTRARIAVVLILLLTGSGALLASRPADAALTCGDLADLTTLYFQKHIAHHQLSSEIRERAIENFLARLDPQKVLFLADDAEGLEDSLTNVFQETRAGDCSRLRKLQHDLVTRHGELEGFVRGYVGEDYELDESARLVVDADKREYAATKEARDAVLRSLVHFQVSNYLAAGTDLAEAKKRLVHRYELATKRAHDMTRDDLYGSFLDAFANALDPHTNYLSADVLEDFQIQMQLSLEGIGVALSERDGFAVVEQIIPGGAADRLDVLRPEDKIIAVSEDGAEPVDVIDMRLRDVVRLIRGKKGTRVHLTVLRQEGDAADRFHVAIVRDTIDLEEQAAKLRIEESTVEGRTLRLGMLELPSFYGDRDPTKRQGSRDVARLLAEAREKEVDGLVLDLSRNGGGLLEDAVTISGFFIREGGVVAIRGEGERPRVLEDPDDGVLWNRPLVVLTSRVSASASEILAGALKDYGRALVVGDDHTFGKGTVQSVFPLRPGQGALKVTTALFYRPGGASTQHDGVEAHLVIPSPFNHDDFGERTLPHSLQAVSIEPFRSTRANTGPEDEEHWTPLDPEVVSEVARRSRVRIEEDPFFQELRTELAEREADEGVVVLSEILAERAEAEREETESADTDGQGGAASPGNDTASVEILRPPGAKPRGAAEEEDLTPQAKEALRILADLVLLTS